MTRVNHPCRKEWSGPFEWCVHEACRPQGRISEEIKRMEKCTATYEDSRKGTVYHCELDATHYDVDAPPAFGDHREDRDPGGWHKSGTEIWADHADGATPHKSVAAEAPAPADVLPQYHADLSFGRKDGDLWAISVHGPAAFVAHVVSSAADAFEEDAQR